MRILFFPNDSGGGFGHISMCLALAKEAMSRGHLCAFSLCDNKFIANIQKECCAIISSAYAQRLKKMLSLLIRTSQHMTPLYTEFSKIDYLVLRDGLVTGGIITKKLKHYLKLIRVFQPDILVSDTDLITRMASRLTGIPVVQVVRYLSHPETAKLIWWKNISKILIAPDGRELFNAVLKKFELPLLKRTEDLFEGDLYIVPGIPEIEPIQAQKTHFVGALVYESVTTEFQWHHADRDRPLVYMTIGGGAGPVGSKLFFSTVIKAFSQLPFHLVVSTGRKFNAHEFSHGAKNIEFIDWVPGTKLISQADLVVFHGGFATMMETLSYGKPSIVVPFHSEQESNGRRLEQLGCGLVIKLSRETPQRVEARWKYGSYSYLVQRSYDLTAEELHQKVQQVLSSPRYAEAARGMQSTLNNYGGAEAAMDLIESRWG